MANIEHINNILQAIFEEEQEKYLSEQIEIFLQEQEELQLLELEKQYEMMSYGD